MDHAQVWYLLIVAPAVVLAFRPRRPRPPRRRPTNSQEL